MESERRSNRICKVLEASRVWCHKGACIRGQVWCIFLYLCPFQTSGISQAVNSGLTKCTFVFCISVELLGLIKVKASEQKLN